MVYVTKNKNSYYRIAIKKSLIIALSLLIILLLLYPTYNPKNVKKKIVHINIVVEDIPITKQGIYRPPPPKPAIPIPTEEESVPEDETIEETNLNFDVSPFISSGTYEGFGSLSYIPPRPVAEVIPEYPKGDYKKGITGTVKLHVKINSNGKVVDVVVLENTTSSNRCAEAAMKAAYQCRYIPARRGNKTISCWTTRLIKFDIPK